MGQKVHPYGFRLGYNKNWQSRWFSKKDYPASVSYTHLDVYKRQPTHPKEHP